MGLDFGFALQSFYQAERQRDNSRNKFENSLQRKAHYSKREQQ
jgi:hypothetical protein